MSTKRRSGFTLLELLIVIAILAILGGAIVASYDGLESRAAQGTAAHSISALDNAIRQFTVIHKHAPHDLDSLVAVGPGDITSGGELINNLPSNLAGKLILGNLTTDQFNALANAGLDEIRYVDIKGNDLSAGGTLDAPAADGSTADVGALEDIEIPNRMFDDPSPGTNQNRGRGFLAELVDGAAVAIWDSGTGGINNTQIGADEDDVLVAFGIGNNCKLFRGDSHEGGNTLLSNAPSYANVARGEYGRFVALYNVGSASDPRSIAKFQAVVDTKGNFLDEVHAQHSGQ